MSISGGFFWDDSFSANSTGLTQFYIVRSTGQNLADICTGSSGGANGPLGILQNDPTVVGEEATVRILGLSKCSAGGTVSIGDWITSTTAGQALTATTTGQRCIGKANSASTAAGQIIEVFMFGPLFYTAGATA